MTKKKTRKEENIEEKGYVKKRVLILQRREKRKIISVLSVRY